MSEEKEKPAQDPSAKAPKADEVVLEKPKRKISKRAFVLLLSGAAVALVMLPTSLLLAVGLLPTFVAILSGRRGRRSQAVSVGAMNLAGCSPFLFQLWTEGHNLEATMGLISDPMSVVVMYIGAGAGYVIDWVLGGIMGIVLYQRQSARLERIIKRQESLVDRWGEVVCGDIPLDPEGFPIDPF